MYCPTCHGDSGPHVCCYACQRYLPQTDSGVRAGLASRSFAFLLDSLILLFFLVTTIWASRSTKQDGPIPTHMLAVVSAASLLYLGAFLSGLIRGQTVGKLVFRLKTVDTWHGQVPGLRKMLLRETVGKLLSALALGFGFFSALRDPDRRTWHDKLAGTVVLAQSRLPAGLPANSDEQPLWPVAILAAFMLLLVSALLAPTLQKPVKDDQASVATKTPSREEATTPSSNLQASPKVAVKPSAMDLVEPASSSPIPRTVGSTEASSALPTPAPMVRRSLERAVTPVPRSPVDSTTPADPAGEINQFLANWSEAEADQGSQQVGKFYAPDVQRYFLRRNVTRSYVVADHQAYLARGRRALFFKVTDVRFQSLSMNSAALEAVKSWNELSPDGTSATRKSTRSRLWLEKYPDGWKIVGEQDLRTQ